MKENDQLIDSPFEASRATRLPTLRDQLDFGFNALLIGAILLFLLGAIFEPGTLFIAALLFLALGVYQFFSAVVGTVNGNVHKRRYLAAISFYLLLIFAIATVSDSLALDRDISWLLAILGVFFLPALGALYYLNLCYQAIKR